MNKQQQQQQKGMNNKNWKTELKILQWFQTENLRFQIVHNSTFFKKTQIMAHAALRMKEQQRQKWMNNKNLKTKFKIFQIFNHIN